MKNLKSFTSISGFQHFFYFMLGTILFVIAGSNASLASSSNILAHNMEGMTADTSKIYRAVDKMPKIKGGLQQIYKNITYPKQAVNNNVEGRVYITFVVDAKGNVQNPKVLRGIGSGCDKAAIKAIKKVKFSPGRLKSGKAVKVKFTLPITFELKNS